MKINTNRWNKLRYAIYEPFYDVVGNIFNASRRKAIATLSPTSSDDILMVGAGTGIDLQFISSYKSITATDITPAMVKRLQERVKKLQMPGVSSLVMDGHRLRFEDNSFDLAMLHLILAVIPDPVKCLQEVERVVKPGGRIVVFDKFVKKGESATLFRKLANLFTSFLFSDINRDIYKIVSHTKLSILSDEEAHFDGNFRIILLARSQVATTA